MKRNKSVFGVARALEASLRIALAGAALIAGGQAMAGNATLSLSSSQSPALATYGQAATFTVTLSNDSNNTINNVGLTVSSAQAAPLPGTTTCSLSTGLPCVPSGPGVASGYQLPSNAKLSVTVSYQMPQATTPLPTFVYGATATSSNNSSGPNPAAYTILAKTDFSATFAPPPPSYPNIKTTIGFDPTTTVLWSTAACSGPNPAPDCGESYYAQYLITVKNDGTTDIPVSRPFAVTMTGGAASFFDAYGCSSPCAQSGNVFTITGLAAGSSTSFTVFFRSPVKPLTIDATATVTIDTPAVVLPPPATTSLSTTPVDAGPTYASVVPPSGGSTKGKNLLDPPNNKGPFSTRLDVPTYSLVDGTPINVILDVQPGTIACSPSSPKCLDTNARVLRSGNPVTFGGINQPLNGTNFLVITMVRDWTTLDKKPSSVFNATVWYTDDAGNRTNVKDCGSVDLTIADRCVYQRIDMTTSAKGVLTGGYVKFIIWARHNGIISW